MNCNNFKGSTKLEYCLISALIALVALASIGTTGVLVQNQFKKSALAMKHKKTNFKQAGNGTNDTYTLTSDKGMLTK